jgi:MFS family permease
MKVSKLSKYLLLASFVGSFSEQMLIPYWSTFVDKVGGSLMDAGIGFAIFQIVTGIVVATLGQTKWFTNNVRLFLLWGFIISGIGEFSYLFVQNKWMLFTVQCIVGVSVGILNPSWDALYSDPDEDAGKKWSFWSGGVSFVVGLASLASAAIVYFLSFQVLFITMGLVDLVAIYYAWMAIKQVPKSETSLK